MIWKIANLASVNADWDYFRVGKITQAKNEVFKNGKFLDLESESSPSTHGFINYQIELFGIVRKSGVFGLAQAIAVKLEQMLNESPIADKNDVRFEVRPIPNPDKFIAALKGAHAIKKFWFNVSPPNAQDEAEIVGAIGETLKRIKAEKAKVEAKGTSIDSNGAEEIARSTTSLGNMAGATIVEHAGEGGKPIKSDDNNPKEVTVEKADLADPDRRTFIVDLIQKAYGQVRKGK